MWRKDGSDWETGCSLDYVSSVTTSAWMCFKGSRHKAIILYISIGSQVCLQSQHLPSSGLQRECRLWHAMLCFIRTVSATFISFYCCSIQRADTYVYSTYACLLVVLKDSWKPVYNSASSFKHLIHYNHTIHSTAFVFHVGTSLFDHKSCDHFPTSVEEVARKQEIHI